MTSSVTDDRPCFARRSSGREGISAGGVSRKPSSARYSDGPEIGVGNGDGAETAASLGGGATVTAGGNGWTDGCGAAAGAYTTLLTRARS